jgi:chromosome segregation ATPase
VILEELNALEKQFSAQSKKIRDLLARIETLERTNREFVFENSGLKSKVIELESKLEDLKRENNNLRNGGALNRKDREDLKAQINELISKIDFHLRS